MTLITEWSYSKYIVASSLLFQIPAYYAYHNHIYSYAIGSFITSVLSMNYWRHATPSWRRNMDLYWAKTAGVCYFLHGMQYSPRWGIHISLLMVFLYYQSCHQYTINPLGNWYLYHMMFHVIASINQMIAIYYVQQLSTYSM